MTYKGKVKERSAEKKILMLIVFFICLFIAYRSEQYMYIPVICILLLAIFNTTEHIVDEEGVTIKRNTLGIKSTDLWRWEEITGIQPDYLKLKPDAQLIFEKDTTLRPFVFSPEVCEEIIALAEKKNPDIYVDFHTKEDQIRINERNKRITAERKAEQEKARAEFKKRRKEKLKLK